MTSEVCNLKPETPLIILPLLQILPQLVLDVLPLLFGLLRPLTFSIPDLRPQPDSATQTAIQTMAILRFVLGATFVFVGLFIPCVFSGSTIIPLALELRVGDVDLLHPLLRILPNFRVQAGGFVGVVGARRLPICAPDLLHRSPLRDPEGLPRHGESGLPLKVFRETVLLLSSLLSVRGRASRSLAGGRIRATILAPLLPEILSAERAGETGRGPAVRDHQAHLEPRGAFHVEQALEDDRDLVVVVPVAGVWAAVRPAEAPHHLHDRSVRRKITFLEKAPRKEGHLQRIVRNGLVAVVPVEEHPLREEDDPVASPYPPDRHLGLDARRREQLDSCRLPLGRGGNLARFRRFQ